MGTCSSGASGVLSIKRCASRLFKDSRIGGLLKQTAEHNK
jgi:hypothetical protein